MTFRARGLIAARVINRPVYAAAMIGLFFLRHSYERGRFVVHLDSASKWAFFRSDRRTDRSVRRSERVNAQLEPK